MKTRPRWHVRRWLLAAGLLAGAGGCRGSATTPQSGAVGEVSSNQVIFGLRHRVTNEGVRKADLYSDTATTRPGSPKIDLKGVKLTFFDENGRQNGQLTSRTGEFDLGGGIMIARGNAVLVLQGPKGPRTIRTEELYYDQRANRVWSTKPTSMEEAGQTYRGSSFESDTQFRNVTVKQLTTSNIRTSGAGLSF